MKDFSEKRGIKILIDYASDIHFEFGGISELMFHPTEGWKPNSGSEVLVLAGDITEVKLLCDKSVRGELIREAFQQWSKQYKEVIWVFGNHEYYGESLNYALPHARRTLEKISCNNVTILHNRTMEVDNVIFFGSTAWTDFNNYNPLDMIQIERGLNDYTYTTVYDNSSGVKEKRKLRATDIELIHRGWRNLFKQFCELKTDKKKVLITHHAPSRLSIPERFHNHHLNAGYAFDVSNELSFSDIKLAIHGHIHSGNSGYMLGECAVVSNTRGYFGHEQGSTDFKPKQIEIV